MTLPELREQFAFLRQVRDTVNAVTTAIIRLRNVRTQLEDRMQPLAAGDAARGAAQALVVKLNALEDSLYQVRLQADEDGLVYPSRPIERLSAQAFIAGAGDARPTAAARQVFTLFAPEVQRGLLALQATLQTDLPAVNAAFKSAPPVEVLPGNTELRPPKARE